MSEPFYLYYYHNHLMNTFLKYAIRYLFDKHYAQVLADLKLEASTPLVNNSNSEKTI